MRKMAYIYGARSKTFLSGSPYYLARALEAFGKKYQSFEVIDLPPKRTSELPWTFLRWSLRWSSLRHGLFLLSQLYHDTCGAQLKVDDGVQPFFVVCAQGIPASILACRRQRPDARIILYLDATLLDLFENFDYAANPPPLLQKRNLTDEKNGYDQTDLFAAFHAGVRDRLVNDYGVDPKKIKIIGRGVNLDLDVANRSQIKKRSLSDKKFHMMIVGRGPKRKGVFRLIEAIDSLMPEEQSRLMLTLAGPEASEVPARPYLRSLGFITEDRREYLAREMAESDLGVLLSDAEGLPGSVWEFLALGVPVWVSDLPHISATLQGYPIIIEDLSFGTEALAERLRCFIHKPQILAELSASSMLSSKDLTWHAQAEILGRFIRDGVL